MTLAAPMPKEYAVLFKSPAVPISKDNYFLPMGPAPPISKENHILDIVRLSGRNPGGMGRSYSIRWRAEMRVTDEQRGDRQMDRRTEGQNI